MNHREKVFVDEVAKALYWIDNNKEQWQHAMIIVGCCTSDEAFSDMVDFLVKEKLYIPLIVFLATQFMYIDTADILKKILVTILICRWDDDMWDTIMETTKQTMLEYMKEKDK